MTDAFEIVANQIRRDNPGWKNPEVWLEVMRAISGQGPYAETYREARKYGRQALKEGPYVE